MAPAIEQFNWYCGNDSYGYGSLTNFTWDIDHTIKDTCFANLIYTAPHVIFIVISSLVLLVLGCCTKLRRQHPAYLIPYPGHYALWILYFPFMFGLLCALGEGLITGVQDNLGQPHLYIPSICATLGGILALVYYHHMEVWSRSGMAVLLLLYWLTALGAEGVRFMNLYYDPDVGTEAADVSEFDAVKFLEVMRVDICILMLALYALFTLISLYSIICKVRLSFFFVFCFFFYKTFQQTSEAL